MPLTPVHPAFDPEAIFARGFVTKQESEAVELSDFASKVNLDDNDNDCEGIWVAFITKEDRALYDSKSYGKPLRAVLLNHSLHFFPNPSWGRVIEGKTNGDSRPIFHRADQIPRFKETHEAYMREYPPPFDVFYVTNRKKRRISVIARDAQQAATLAVTLRHAKQRGNVKVEEVQPSAYANPNSVAELCALHVAGQLSAEIDGRRMRARLTAPGESEPHYSEWETPSAKEVQKAADSGNQT